ncbi:MAG: NDP-sugar synthase [Candidatus Margulisbacteria bacterium]|nr:NDP-sugar synthase [Candidatus Margulisiibacteriota bacterium]
MRHRAITNPGICSFARPKPMLPLLNRVLIDYSINALQRLGVQMIHVGTGPRPMSEILERHLAELETPSFRINAFSEKSLLDTAGTLKYIMENFLDVDRGDTICVLPCDTPNNIDLKPILLNHLHNNAALTVAALPIRWSSTEWKERTFGTIKLGILPTIAEFRDRNHFETALRQRSEVLHGQSFRVETFCEQEERDRAQSNLISTAIYFFQAGLLMDLAPFITPREADPRFSDIGLHILPLLGGRHEEFASHNINDNFIRKVKRGDYPFYAYLLPGNTYWRDIGNPLALLQANLAALQMNAGQKPNEEAESVGRFPSSWQSLGELARKFRNPSFIDESAVIRSTARIRNSVILGNTDIAGHIKNSIVFPGSHQSLAGKSMMRRNVISRGVRLVNCIFVGGTLGPEFAPKTISDRIIYETIHGGLAFDPI